MKVYYKFNGTTHAKTFKNDIEMREFFNKYKMLKIINIEP